MGSSCTTEMLSLVLVIGTIGLLSVGANYAPAPDNVVIAAPHRHTDTRTHGDVEYPTNEEVFADPEVREHLVNNYNKKTHLKHRLHAIIIPESESDIVIGTLPHILRVGIPRKF